MQSEAKLTKLGHHLAAHPVGAFDAFVVLFYCAGALALNVLMLITAATEQLPNPFGATLAAIAIVGIIILAISCAFLWKRRTRLAMAAAFGSMLLLAFNVNALIGLLDPLPVRTQIDPIRRMQIDAIERVDHFFGFPSRTAAAAVCWLTRAYVAAAGDRPVACHFGAPSTGAQKRSGPR